MFVVAANGRASGSKETHRVLGDLRGQFVFVASVATVTAPLHRPRIVVRTSGPAAPPLPRALERERTARAENRVDLSIAEKRDGAKRPRFHLKVGVQLEIDRGEDD